MTAHARSRVWLCVVTLLLFNAVAGHAQVLQGRVTDLTARAPLAGVQVSLFDRSAARLAEAVTDSTGLFRFGSLREGSYTLRAVALGYDTITTGLLRLDRQEVANVELRISARPIPLDSIMVVTRTKATGRLAQYYNNLEWGRRSGAGRFVTRAQIDSVVLPYVTDYLQRIANIPIQGFGQTASVVGRRVDLCESPALILDGMPLPAARINDIPPTAIEGIEIYRSPTEVPLEYGNLKCGAVVIWTRAAASNAGSSWFTKAMIGATLAGLILVVLKAF